MLNKCCSFELFIYIKQNKNPLKMYHGFHKKLAVLRLRIFSLYWNLMNVKQIFITNESGISAKTAASH